MVYDIDSEEKGNILAVDDTPENLRLLIDILRKGGNTVRLIPDGALALRAVQRELPDLILLDINMPGMDGYEVCRQLKDREQTRDIPVIFISAFNETIDKVKAFDVGGVDYVTKPFQIEEVKSRVRTHLRLRRMQLQLQQSFEKLRELEKVRDSLVHMIVHDMSGPLAIIRNYLELTESSLEQDKDRTIISRYVGNSISAVDRLSEMVRNLLDISRMEEGRMPMNVRFCDLPSLVREVIDQYEPLFRSQNIRAISPETPMAGFCDYELVRRVVENLVRNALKYIEKDGELKVVVTPQGKELRISITDTGPGIAAEYQEKIFEKFGRGKVLPGGRQHSAGLGLTFCKLAVEAHGGRIGVESDGAHGSTFWFTLPTDSTKEVGHCDLKPV